MLNVYMMDLWCQTPFYDAYLCNALKREGVACVLGSTGFHLEPGYFRRRGLVNDPGLSSFASCRAIANPQLRRTVRFLEFCLNVVALAFRFLFVRPDIIHVQWVPLVDEGVPIELWFLQLAKWFGIKLVYTVHNLLPHDPEKNYKDVFTEVYGLMDALVCHTRETRDRLTQEFGIDPQKIRIIPHGPLFYDCEPLSREEAKRHIAVSPQHCMVLYQGLIRPYKGIEFLLQAWTRVQAQEPNARLIIAGRGEDRHMETVRTKVESLGLQSSVRLDLRYITSKELPIYYQACDIAVYLHKEITQSGALMTGMAFGKPIIATALAGFREALENYNAALYVEYGDVEGLSRFLVQLIGDPGQRELLESNASRQDADASWRTIARQTRECYEDVLKSTGPAPTEANYAHAVQDRSLIDPGSSRITN